MIAERHFAAGQIQGARPYQEDDYGFYQPESTPGELLAVLADGMGGATAGAKASATVVGTFLEAFAALPGSVPARLAAALRHANRQLALEIEAHPELAGMGCTLLATACTPGGLHWISVGDSPLYLLRGGGLQRLNADHSVHGALEIAQRENDVPRMESLQAEAPNALLSAVTGQALGQVDGPQGPLPLQDGDGILLGSDGLLCLNPIEIAQAFAQAADARRVALALLEAIQQKNLPQQDNASVLVLLPPRAPFWRRWRRAEARILAWRAAG